MLVVDLRPASNSGDLLADTDTDGDADFDAVVFVAGAGTWKARSKLGGREDEEDGDVEAFL